MEDSPVFESLLQSTKPMIWEIGQTLGKRTAERRILSDNLFREFGLINGVDFPVHTAQGNRGAVSFAGNRPVPCAWELMELSFLSALVYERLKSFAPAKSTVDKLLSRREKECLQWTAAGKTSLEIATILEISEHTVNHYLSTVCQKLDANNRAHMVSKAMRMGLLQ
jgi:DNA-binding CsgD family transcriptional regulator